MNDQPSQTSRSELLAYAALTTTALCWSFNVIFGKLAVGEISPMMMVIARWFAVVLLLAIFAPRHIRRDWPVLRQHMPWLIAMGMCGFAFFNGLFYVAAHSTSGLNIGIIQGAIPIFVVIGMFGFFGERLRWQQVAGVLLTMAGVVLTVSKGELATLAGLSFARGDLFMLLAALLYAAYTIGLRRRPQVSAMGMFTAFAVVALITSAPMVAGELALGAFQWPTPKGWLIVVGVALLPSFLAQITFIHGVEIAGPARAGVFVNLVPVLAALWVVIFLGEELRLFHGLSLALVIGGIWIVERFKGL